MNLFNVTTTIRAVEFHGCRDVTMQWFVVDRPAPVVPYSEAVADYGALDDNDKLYVHDAVDELFTDNEARTLVEYMAREQPLGSARDHPCPPSTRAEHHGARRDPGRRAAGLPHAF